MNKKKYKYYYGFNTVKNLIKFKFNYINKIYLINKNSKNFFKIKKLILLRNISYKIVNNNFFKKLNILSHQGVMALVKNKKMFLNDINKLIYLIKKKNTHFFIILDRINDPYNLGSCIRTAVAANIDAIILTKYNSVSIENNIVHKVSVGSIYKINIIVINNINDVIKIFNKYNFLILGTDIKSKKNIYEINFNNYKSIVLIFGSENNGIRRKVKEKCNFLFKIPIKNINSLNVSVSKAIIIFEILRQRNYNISPILNK